MDGPAPVPTSRITQSSTSGAKDAVTTSLTGRVWATVGQGILNEVELTGTVDGAQVMLGAPRAPLSLRLPRRERGAVAAAGPAPARP